MPSASTSTSGPQPIDVLTAPRIPAPRPGAALITGASSGLGERFAQRLAERGYNLVLVARDEQRLRHLAAALHDRFHIKADVLIADLSDRHQLQRVVDRIMDAEQQRIDVLVNNAGYGVNDRASTGAPEVLEKLFDVLTRAVLLLSRAAVGPMISRGQGLIINVGSVAGLVPGGGHYSAAKAYVLTFTETLAEELRGTGVSATALLPGYTITEFQARAGKKGRDQPNMVWLDADRVVQEALAAAESGRTICIPGWQYRALATAIPLLPRALTRRVWNRTKKNPAKPRSVGRRSPVR